MFVYTGFIAHLNLHEPFSRPIMGSAVPTLTVFILCPPPLPGKLF